MGKKEKGEWMDKVAEELYCIVWAPRVRPSLAECREFIENIIDRYEKRYFEMIPSVRREE